MHDRSHLCYGFHIYLINSGNINSRARDRFGASSRFSERISPISRDMNFMFREALRNPALLYNFKSRVISYNARKGGDEKEKNII